MRGLTKLIGNKSEKQKLPTETISSKTPEEITAKQEEINLQCKARGNNVAKRVRNNRAS